MMKKRFNAIFISSILICIVIMFFAILFPAFFEDLANTIKNFISENLGWWYTALMTSFVIFIVWLGFFSKYKEVRLGADNGKPKYSFRVWFAMLFSAGMGIGLVFWGVAEPLNYFVSPLEGDPGSAEAMEFAMSKSLLHWGIHPWCSYAVLALPLAYFWFRKKQKGLISPVLAPIFGERISQKWIGKFVDILAVIATVAGVSTSLGLGAMQINSGLNAVFGCPENNVVLIGIIITVTLMFLASAISGVDRGIKFLSRFNVWICMIVAILCMLVGPLKNIINTIVESTGLYIQNMIHSSFSMGAFGDSEWYGTWTIFYWGWWIAWAPFSAVFIARISEGRTIKEFCTGVVVVPAIVAVIWFSIMGRLGMDLGLDVAKDAITNTSTAFFSVLGHYPLGSFISIIAIILLCTFFVTSADSATFVLGILTSNGNLNPGAGIKITWGIVLSAMAIALLLYTQNGLNMLQTMSIVGALPFSIVMLISMISIVKEFITKEKRMEK